MINYPRINKLARMYKAISESEKAKNLIFTELLREYEPILHKLYCELTGDHDDLKSIFVFQLLSALDKYDIDNKAQFNTFAFYYLKAVHRIFIKENNSLGYSDPPEQIIDEISLNDYNIDVHNILTDREQLILTAYCNGRCGFVSKLYDIRSKLTEYIEE